MNPKFRYNPIFEYPEMESITEDNGKRRYLTPLGWAPSVTTILGSLPNPGIDAWKARVGPEEAKRVSEEATIIGKSLHDRLERYVKGETEIPPETDLDRMAFRMFTSMKMFGLNRLEEVWAVEAPLHCYDLYAGRTDLLGVYNGVGSIIDYKNSRRKKTAEYVHHYKLQTAAYAASHECMFDFPIHQGVILVAVRPDRAGRSEIQKFIIERDEMDQLKQEWFRILDAFHS